MNRSTLLAVILAVIAVPAAVAFVVFTFGVSSASSTSAIDVVDGPDGWRAIVDSSEAWGSSDSQLRLQPPEAGAAAVVLVPWGDACIRWVHWEAGPLLVVTGSLRDELSPHDYTPSYRYVAIRYDWAR